LAVVREIAHALKVAEPSAVAAAASAMARLVPRGALLVPVPSSRGDTRPNAVLAEALARLVGGRVVDGLRREPSESQYARLLAGLPPLTPGAMRLRWAAPPPRETAWLVDNVVTTGATLAAAAAAVPGPSAAVVWADGGAARKPNRGRLNAGSAGRVSDRERPGGVKKPGAARARRKAASAL